MSSAPHPFASAGGGTLFEYKVATLLAADLILSRHTGFGGPIAAIDLQRGPEGFDDLQLSVELLTGGARTVHAQCRYKQRFTGSDRKFGELINQAAAVVLTDEMAFAAETKRLAVIVDSSSPQHESMAKLCELAHTFSDFDRFHSEVNRRGGDTKKRWTHCVRAAGDLEPEPLHRILASLEVHAFALDSATSPHSVELINRLAALWDPPDQLSASNLADAVFRQLTELGPVAGTVDIDVLRPRLGSLLPATLGANTRREKLQRKRDGGHQRTVSRLTTIGLGDTEADKLATQVLAAPPRIEAEGPITVVEGPIGVGKSTELERLHREAINEALENRNAPIPIFVTAAEVGQSSLMDALLTHVEGLGDPSRVGVHLIIDGLDEADVQIGELTLRIATMRSEWRNSVVLLGTRPQEIPHGVESAQAEPMTPEDAQSLMEAIDANIVSLDWFREELAEVLECPLFAIRFALDHREGRSTGVDQSQLVSSVGEQALRDLGETSDEVFDLLVRLARQVVDSSGRPVNPGSLGVSPIRVSRLLRSRIMHAVDGLLTFHLAALTEWFAAHALLQDPAALAHSVSSPSLAHRWRYVFVQALLQGSAADVDNIMTTLLTHVPATAAWVHHETRPRGRWRRSELLGVDTQQAGMRIRRATKAWYEPWPDIVKPWNGEELPTLGIAADDDRLATAWHADSPESTDEVVPLPPTSSWFDDPSSPWDGIKVGRPGDGDDWPWEWTRDQVQRAIEHCFEDRRLLADIELCWPELAWDFAYEMVRRSTANQSGTVLRTDLEAAVARYRAIVPEGEVIVSGSGSGWRLSDGIDFIADLANRGISEIRSAWSPAGIGDDDEYQPWTTEQRLASLDLTTKTGLDVYGAVVRMHLPSMAPELTTFQLLPARIVGMVTPYNPANERKSPYRHRWHIEPLPVGSQNEAQWNLVSAEEFAAKHDWESQVAAVQAVRGELADRMRYRIHLRDPARSRTPAGLLALDLLRRDLAEYEWVSGPGSVLGDIGSTRPRYTRR